MRADNVKMLAGELFGPARTHQERDVTSGANEASAKISAQCAGSDYQNAHLALPRRLSASLSAIQLLHQGKAMRRQNGKNAIETAFKDQ
jgi:hypothetical protein